MPLVLDAVGEAVAPVSGEAVFLKLESLQHSGSFKMRGAANRLAKLLAESGRPSIGAGRIEGAGQGAGAGAGASGGATPGVVAVSSGNHGRAVAEAGRRLGVPVMVCVPEWADPSKLRAIRGAGARAVVAGPSYDHAEREAARLEVEKGLTMVHPFDEPDVIEGQGTLGLEIVEQVPGVQEVIVPLSGGGLVAGVALALRSQAPGVRVVAVSAERAAVMHRSLLAGRPVEIPDEETLASALSGGIGLDNRFTFEIVRGATSEHVIVSEEAVRAAVARAFRELRLVVEGGGAVGLAALWSGAYRPRGAAVVVVSGGNIDPPALARVLAIEAEPPAPGRRPAR